MSEVKEREDESPREYRMKAAAVGAGAAALAMYRAGFSKAQMLEMMSAAWEIMLK